MMIKFYLRLEMYIQFCDSEKYKVSLIAQRITVTMKRKLIVSST